MQRRMFWASLLGLVLLAVVGPARSVSPAADEARPAPPLNDGYTLHLNAVPQRAVTLNQAPTEIMLALGLADRMVGTAYLDDAILPDLSTAYGAVRVLAARYPSKEVLLDADPDFVYGGFASAFSERHGLPSRKVLHDMGIHTYLSPSFVARTKTAGRSWHVGLLYREIEEIGRIFKVEKRAGECIAHIKETLATVVSEKKTTSDPPAVLWIDNLARAEPFVGGGAGVPNAIITLAGGKNVFADVADDWVTVSQEQIVGRQIDLIVLVDTAWNTAEAKGKQLAADPIYRHLPAVDQQRYAIIPFSASIPGIRVPQAVLTLARALRTFAPSPEAAR